MKGIDKIIKCIEENGFRLAGRREEGQQTYKKEELLIRDGTYIISIKHTSE